MRLIVDQSLAMGLIPINTRQQRASLPFKPGVLERKEYNNDDKTFFSILTFAKPECDNVLQPSTLRGSGCYILSHTGLANVNKREKMFYPLSKTCVKRPLKNAVRAATHYVMRGWQTLIYRKECYIVIVIYLPFKPKHFQISLFNCTQKYPP